MDNINKYKVEELILNKEFRKWILQPDKESNAYWEEWLLKHPDELQTIKEARTILLHMHIDKQSLSEVEFNKIWNDISSIIKDEEKEKEAKKVIPLNSYVITSRHQHIPVRKTNNYIRYAATIAILLVAGLVFYLNQVIPTVEYTTGYGETKRIVLPDNTIVTLNANSRLKINDKWNNTTDRKVVLEGEAFFEVAHKQNHQKFLVETNDLTISVLGTKFNVKKRRDETQVILSEGKVAINLEGKPEDLIMKPGELVQVSKEKGQLIQKVVEPDMYTSWRQNVWKFNDTPLNDIVDLIHDKYGVDVVIENKKLSERKFTANVPSDDLDVLLALMEETFDLKIKTEEKAITIGQR